MKGDHSRPQSELVGAPWAGPGAAAALQRPHPSPGPHSDALGDPRPWGVARRSRGAGPRSANPLPMETSMPPPLPALAPADTPAQNPSPAGHPWGCRQQGTARLAVAHPPGVPLLQGRALGFRRVLDHSSGLPREVHRHQRVLRDAALQGQSHQRWDRATRRGTPAISARGTWPSCARRDTERAPRDP